jgi:hypothetical protein
LHKSTWVGQEGLQVVLKDDSLQQAAAESGDLEVAAVERSRKFEDVAQAQACDHVVQGADIVVGVVIAIFVVVIVHSEDQCTVAARGGIEIADHVVPRLLGGQLAPQDHFEKPGGRIRLQNGGVETGAKQQGIEGHHADAGG